MLEISSKRPLTDTSTVPNSSKRPKQTSEELPEGTDQGKSRLQIAMAAADRACALDEVDERDESQVVLSSLEN